MHRTLGIFRVLVCFAVLSCGDGSSSQNRGKVRVLLNAEDTISMGLRAGTSVEDARDYGVRFTKYLATVGNVSLGRSQGGLRASLPGTFVADMTQVGDDGVELGMVDELNVGEWDQFAFETPIARSNTKALEGVSAKDLTQMVENGWTYWIEGEVLRPSAEGGPVRFIVQTDVPTRFSNCELDGEPGVTVVEDRPATATITLHGDHIFFNAISAGNEGTIERLSGWVIEADKDKDGVVTTDDLRNLDATDVFTISRGYSLDGVEIPIENALDFVRVQLSSQGHYKGEGECLFQLLD